MPADKVAEQRRQGIEELIGLLYADTPLEKIEQRACALARSAVDADCVFLLVKRDGNATIAAESCTEGAARRPAADAFIARALAKRGRLFDRGEPPAVAVPLAYGERTLGAFVATDAGRNRQFSEYDANVLDVYARYVAIAQANHATIGKCRRHLHIQRRATWILSAAVVLITIAIALFGWFDNRIAAGRTTIAARQSADVSADHFERFVASAAQLSAATAAVAPRLRGDRAGTERLLNALLESARTDVVYGIGLWYEPYAFSSRTRLFGPYVHRFVHGGIALTYVWSSPSYNYPTHPWYRTAARAGTATAITQPYFDVDHVYISAMHQLRVNGRFIGAASVDMTSQSIDMFLRHVSSPDHVTYVSGLDGHVVAFPNSDALLTFAKTRHAAKRILDVTAADAAAFIAKDYPRNRITVRTPLRPMPLLLVNSWNPAVLAAAPVPLPFLIAITLVVWGLAATALFLLRHAHGKTRQVLDVDRERSRLQMEIDTHLQAQTALKQAAQTDQLTGVADRFALIRAIDNTIRQRANDGHASDGLLLLDINGLEAINQQAGHAAGDEVLVHAASLIRRCCDEGDLPARLGGDEFAILVRGGARQRASTIAQCVLRGMSSGVRVADQTLFVDATTGFVEFGAEYQNAHEIIRDADYAITHAKRRGNGMIDFSPNLRAAANRERELQAALRGALARGELRVAYQPIYRLKDRTIVGVEALARWYRDSEVVLPSEFIPVAERTGLVLDIDRYVAHAAMRRVRALDSAPGLRLSLNVSALHFKSPEAFHALQRTLAEPAAPPPIDIELTETALMSLEGHPDQLVAQLHRSGVGMHLDDFGTGYSSLAYLKHLHVDALKIDRSFVTAMLHEERAMQIVDAIVQLARRLRINTIVEGIESQEQEHVMRDLGATMGQGNFYAEPMAGEALERALAAAR